MKYDFDKQIERRGTYCYKWGKSVLRDEDTIPMMVADMDLPSPDPVVKAMHEVADHRMYGYTTFDGNPEYSLCLCDWFKKRHDWEISPDEVIPSYGTFGALEHAVRMVTDKGETAKPASSAWVVEYRVDVSDTMRTICHSSVSISYKFFKNLSKVFPQQITISNAFCQPQI